VVPEVYSYEGPFGVGYMVARIGVGAMDSSRRIIENRRNKEKRVPIRMFLLPKEPWRLM